MSDLIKEVSEHTASGTEKTIEDLMMDLARLEAKVEQFEIDISQRIHNTFDIESISKVHRKATEMASAARKLFINDIHRFDALVSKAATLRRIKTMPVD